MRRVWVLSAVLAVATVACSGGGFYGRGYKPRAADLDNSPQAYGTVPGDLASPGVDPSLSPGATPGLPGTTPGGSGPGGIGGTSGTTGGSSTGVTGYTIPNLYTPAEDRRGLTSGQITLCGHAALSLAAVFGVDQGDLKVYWEYVNNELGGVYGRKVNMVWTDDKYGNQPGDAPAAYQACKDTNPFILLGGVGFDQVPQVRALAEQDHQLYIHHIAREDFTKKYSFSYLPSVETTGRLAAQWILKAHAGQPIGVVYRNSENWEPGHRTFDRELSRRHVKPVADLPVDKNDTVYSQQIRTLKNSGAKVVFVWENALAAIEIIHQARQQDFNPKWVVFPFNLMIDKLGRNLVEPIPAEGIAMWPAYRPGDLSGPYASYADEIRFFERIHGKYGSGKADDIVWMTWLGMRQLHRLLLDCGRDCTRNKVVGLLRGNVETPILGSCGFDFARNGHVGGFAVNIFEAYMAGGSDPAWKNISECKTSF